MKRRQLLRFLRGIFRGHEPRVTGTTILSFRNAEGERVALAIVARGEFDIQALLAKVQGVEIASLDFQIDA